MTDLTQINVPFGLLDPETQEALKAHGGPYEYYDGPDWVEHSLDVLGFSHWAWRVKPTPPQPRTIYLCEFRDGERSLIDATKAALAYGHGATVSEWEEKL